MSCWLTINRGRGGNDDIDLLSSRRLLRLLCLLMTTCPTGRRKQNKLAGASRRQRRDRARTQPLVVCRKKTGSRGANPGIKNSKTEPSVARSVWSIEAPAFDLAQYAPILHRPVAVSKICKYLQGEVQNATKARTDKSPTPAGLSVLPSRTDSSVFPFTTCSKPGVRLCCFATPVRADAVAATVQVGQSTFLPVPFGKLSRRARCEATSNRLPTSSGRDLTGGVFGERRSSTPVATQSSSGLRKLRSSQTC